MRIINVAAMMQVPSLNDVLYECYLPYSPPELSELTPEFNSLLPQLST